MPWPMVHFAIALKVMDSFPSPHFLIGSIAPDSIHVRENATRKEKGFTHLVEEDGTLPSVAKLTSFAMEYLSKNTGAEWKQFVLGYFAHLYADLRWTETLYSDFDQNYVGDRNTMRQTYNKEVSQIEFYLMSSVEQTDRVLLELKQANAFTIEPFLTQTEIETYRDQKLAWLNSVQNEPKINPVYFKEEIVRNFIINTSQELNELFNEWGIAVI